jgi:nucleoside-diphosphate-sugar epimerase
LLGGGNANANLSFAEGDARDKATLDRAFAQHDIDAVVCTTGTTAFPSKRWEGNNGPRPTDLDGNLNLINACPRSLKRFIFVTSAGVERQKEFPWLVLNLYGVLTFKRAAEIALEESGLPWTVLRPSRLVDGPYTSFDLNTLLKATSESQGLRGVDLKQGDCFKGQASRVAVAEACVQALQSEKAEGRAFAIESVAAGAGPGADEAAWRVMFERAAA